MLQSTSLLILTCFFLYTYLIIFIARQTSFGCFSELITLSCLDGGLINVTEAYYGKYSTPCGSNECCMPNETADCRVSVSENRPGDWAELKLVCSNRTSCQYEYQGSSIDDCEENYLADYMQIYYSCDGEGMSNKIICLVY